MTHFLANSDRPDGYKLEGLLTILRADLVERMSKIARDTRPQAQQVFTNDVEILECLTRALNLAEENSKLLHQSFGPPKKGEPRIGEL